ncbi:MAG: DNA-directed RNA polymerase subunit E'', partial [Haloferacaceae archaeon]
MAKRLVCRECHRLQDSAEIEACVVCGSTSLTEDWACYVVISHPEQSE